MDENYSLEQEQKEYEIASNPELQRNELNPSVAKVMYSHEKVYKTLATVGDFICHIWYYDDNYDPQRSTEGSKRIHIVPTDNILKHDTDSEQVNHWFNVANDKWNQGVIFVNPVIRRNGVKFVSNSDLRDCVKYMSGVAAHYDANSNEIVAIDIKDGNKMYEMSYDISSSKIYSDISNNVYDDFTSGPVGNGSLSLSYTQKFGSGQISMSDLAVQLNGSSPENFSQYYRGNKVANISQNNNVPTSGTFSFSQLRNVTTAVVANCNGNWQHLQARYEVFTGNLYTSSLNKRLNLNGNFGGTSSNPALRFNSGGSGNIDVYVVNTNGNPCVRGFGGSPGQGGTGPGDGIPSNGQGGGNGNLAIQVATPIRMPSGHLSSRIRGGGGGGGGGGKGGKGGGGGHGGGRKCRGWFCNSSQRVCHDNGGEGGRGGNGGPGGTGAGYVWNGNNAFAAHSGAGGGGGAGGQGGSSRGGGRGGNGGNGGNGGGFESNGAGGNTGNNGSQGGSDEQGCGYRGNRSGGSGSGGGGGGGNSGKISYSNNGGITNI